MITLISIIVLIISANTTKIVIPLVDKIGQRYNLIDHQNERKQDKEPLITIGGIAIGIGSLSVLTFGIYISKLLGMNILTRESYLYWVGGAIIALVLGLTDDIFRFKPTPRLIIQIILSILLCIKGISVTSVNMKFLSFNSGIFILPKILSPKSTVSNFSSIAIILPVTIDFKG